MRSVPHPKFFLFLLAGLCTQAPAFSQEPSEPNYLPVDVDASFNQLNTPFVSVTLCTPGTRTCQTIPNIKLDTGSVGLRVFQSVLKIALTQERDPAGNPVALCGAFGGGEHMWGPVQKADVALGKETAPQVSIQVVDANFGPQPAPCPGPVTTPKLTGENGILGIGTPVGDCGGKSCQGAPYFSCGALSCVPSALPPNQQLQNPVALMPVDNNGVTLVFPEIAREGQPSARGSLFLGVGTRSNNPTQSTESICQTGPDGWFTATYNGETYWSMIDSGTNSFAFPDVATNIARCGSPSPYFCPTSPQLVDVTLNNRSGGGCSQVQMGVSVSPERGFSLGNRAFNDIGEQWGGGTSHSLLLGMPFFFGKSISFAIDGQSTPLGQGPFVAF